MEVKDLMIGDWVKVKHLNKIGKVYRIDAANGDKNGFVALLDGDFSYNDIEPIKLTPEILEKNGWSEDPCRWNSHNFPEDKNYDVEIYCDGNDVKWTINCWEYTIMNLTYVHELQHVLKLFHIDKEIIL